jgi:hypothetical protein
VPPATVRRSPKPDSLPRESRTPGPVRRIGTCWVFRGSLGRSARSIGTCWVFRGSLGPVYAVHRALSGLPRKSRPGPRAPSEPLGLPWESRAGVCGLTGLVGLRRKSRTPGPGASGPVGSSAEVSARSARSIGTVGSSVGVSGRCMRPNGARWPTAEVSGLRSPCAWMSSAGVSARPARPFWAAQVVRGRHPVMPFRCAAASAPNGREPAPR